METGNRGITEITRKIESLGNGQVEIVFRPKERGGYALSVGSDSLSEFTTQLVEILSKLEENYFFIDEGEIFEVGSSSLDFSLDSFQDALGYYYYMSGKFEYTFDPDWEGYMYGVEIPLVYSEERGVSTLLCGMSTTSANVISNLYDRVENTITVSISSSDFASLFDRMRDVMSTSWKRGFFINRSIGIVCKFPNEEGREFFQKIASCYQLPEESFWYIENRKMGCYGIEIKLTSY